MRKVEVDLADLEALVFATGVIKTIEGALGQRQNDPFVKPHLPLTEASNRLAAAMRNATRAEAGTAVNWDEPLTEKELALLGRVYLDQEQTPDMSLKITVKERLETKEYDTLLAKGCIVFGVPVWGVLWNGEDRPFLDRDPFKLLVRMTSRGKEKLGEKLGT